MTGTYCYKRPNTYAHCWHEDKLLHTMNPPQRLEQCCWCKEAQLVPAVREITEPSHGPHIPRKPA
jgi:hypothetical protein